MAAGEDRAINLFDAFVNYNGAANMINTLFDLLREANSPALAVFAIQGLENIEFIVKRRQFCLREEHRTILREYMRKWRSETPLKMGIGGWPKKSLKGLTIFEIYGVPLLIDDYGEKTPVSCYEETVRTNNPEHGEAIGELLKVDDLEIRPETINIEDIDIHEMLEAPIVHVTHFQEATQIAEDKEFKPSDNKNIMTGVWFELKDQLGEPACSVYGNCAFETTLAKLGVKGLRQGEIVSYPENDVNVILYATEDETSNPVRKPTNDAVKKAQNNANAYVHVSIFVPEIFLPGEGFITVVRGPENILHGGFCVKDISRDIKCEDLNLGRYQILNKIINDLLLALGRAKSPALAVLALQGFYNVFEDIVRREQFKPDSTASEKIRQYLRQWRSESLIDMGCAFPPKAWPKTLSKSLTIFKTLKVPLFTDDYGHKLPMSHYEDIVTKKKTIKMGGLTIYRNAIKINSVNIEDILEKPILHVTHSHEAQQIVDTETLKPSDNKNIMEGMWFTLKDQLENPGQSVYGTQAFETTLKDLGVEWLRQGEIVSYKNEVNVILYASCDKTDTCVKIPTKEVAQVSQKRLDAYVHVSIFIPIENVGKTPEEIFQVLRWPYKVLHQGFCIKNKRRLLTAKCVELTPNSRSIGVDTTDLS